MIRSRRAPNWHPIASIHARQIARDHANRAVASDVILGLAKRAPPPILPANEIRERVVRALIPDLSIFDHLGLHRAMGQAAEICDQQTEKDGGDASAPLHRSNVQI